MVVIIDRFEGMFAVCEDENKRMINIEKSRIPDDASEGDVLVINGTSISIDVVQTQRRKEEIEKLTKDMWN